MSTSTICANCRFFKLADETTGAGTCRRFPPMPMMVPQSVIKVNQSGVGFSSIAPPVGAEFYCGEWREREMADAASVGSADSD